MGTLIENEIRITDRSACLTGKEVCIVHILHDGIIVEAREDIADVVVVTIKDIMEQTFKGILPEVPMFVEPVVSDSWQ